MSLFTLFFTIALLVNSSMAASLPGNSLSETGENVYTECGGTVLVSASEPAIISYKENQTYLSDERCIWAIIPAQANVTLSSISFTVVSHGIENDFSDGFIFYSWTEHGIFDGDAWFSLRNNYTYETAQGFLYFSSAFSLADRGQGFRLAVTAVESSATSKIERRDVLKYEGKVSCAEPNGNHVEVVYPPFPDTSYADNTKAAIVLQLDKAGPFRESIFKLNYLDVEEGTDVVEEYSLRPFHFRDSTHYKLGVYTGHHTDGFEETSSYESRLVLFSSDFSGSGRGFQFSWH